MFRTILILAPSIAAGCSATYETVGGSSVVQKLQAESVYVAVPANGKYNATVYVGSGSHAVFGGDTSGSGNFPGSGLIEFVDGFSPGSSPAAVSFGGDVLLGSLAEVEIELLGTTAGGQHDQLTIAGTVNLDGTLESSL